MRRLTSVASATALAAIVLGVLAAPPAWASEDSSPWIRYQQPDLTIPAGRACSFPVDEHVVNDHEEYQALETWPDGSSKTEDWKGLLVITFTNADSGASVTKNINGRSLIEYTSDGGFSSITILSGHFVGTIRPGNPTPPGLWYVSGKGSSESIGPDGVTIELGPNGSMENLCDDLAG